jgi:hypothetical protein
MAGLELEEVCCLLFASPRLLILVSSSARSGVGSSAIIGMVTDATQAALPGATVTVTQIGTGAQRVVTTDSEGRFSVPGLRAAVYSVKIELAGFAPAELSEVTLRSGETVRPIVSLRLGASRSVSVQAGAAAPDRELRSAPSTRRYRGASRHRPPLLNIAALAPVSASVQAHVSVRTTRPVRHRRGRARQLDELRDRRCVCAIAALQQHVAQPSHRHGSGSQRASQLVFD